MQMFLQVDTRKAASLVLQSLLLANHQSLLLASLVLQSLASLAEEVVVTATAEFKIPFVDKNVKRGEIHWDFTSFFLSHH